MILLQTTRAVQTGRHSHYEGMATGASSRAGDTIDNVEDGAGTTFGSTASNSYTADGTSGKNNFEAGGTTDESGGWTTSESYTYHRHYTDTRAVDINESFSHSQTSPGAHTALNLKTGVRTQLVTDFRAPKSGTFEETYYYPTSTLVGTVPSTTQTSSTDTQVMADFTDNIHRTYQAPDYSTLVCDRCEVVETAARILDHERVWVYGGGGGGIQPLQDIAAEAFISFGLREQTTTSARVLPVVNGTDTISYHLLEITESYRTVSYTTTATALETVTLLSTDSLPNSTLTSVVGGTTTTKTMEALAIGATAATATAGANATETYFFVGFLGSTVAEWIPAYDALGSATGLTTRSAGLDVWTTGAGTRAADIAESGDGFTRGISETIAVAVPFTGFVDLGLGAVGLYGPKVPFGVRVYDSTREKVWAQIAVAGLGFTVPAPSAFSLFERDGGVFSPMDGSWTATDVSAGVTRSYTATIGTTASADLVRFLRATRATVSTTASTGSGSFANSHELTHRWREANGQDAEPDPMWHLDALDFFNAGRWIVGGRQPDTRLEIAILGPGVSDYTTVENTTTHDGVIATNPNQTTSAAASALLAFRRLNGYSTRAGAGVDYSVTPKWPEPDYLQD